MCNSESNSDSESLPLVPNPDQELELDLGYFTDDRYTDGHLEQNEVQERADHDVQLQSANGEMPMDLNDSPTGENQEGKSQDIQLWAQVAVEIFPLLLNCPWLEVGQKLVCTLFLKYLKDPLEAVQVAGTVNWVFQSMHNGASLVQNNAYVARRTLVSISNGTGPQDLLMAQVTRSVILSIRSGTSLLYMQNQAYATINVHKYAQTTICMVRLMQKHSVLQCPNPAESIIRIIRCELPLEDIEHHIKVATKIIDDVQKGARLEDIQNEAKFQLNSITLVQSRSTLAGINNEAHACITLITSIRNNTHLEDVQIDAQFASLISRVILNKAGQLEAVLIDPDSPVPILTSIPNPNSICLRNFLNENPRLILSSIHLGDILNNSQPHVRIIGVNQKEASLVDARIHPRASIHVLHLMVNGGSSFDNAINWAPDAVSINTSIRNESHLQHLLNSAEATISIDTAIQNGARFGDLFSMFQDVINLFESPREQMG